MTALDPIDLYATTRKSSNGLAVTARDCADEGTPERRVRKQVPSGEHGASAAWHHVCRLLRCCGRSVEARTPAGRTRAPPRVPPSPAATVAPRSATTSLGRFLILLLIGALAVPDVASATPVNAQVLSPSDPLVLHLLDLCRSDALCTTKWYMPPPPQLDPPSDTDRAKFTRMLILFAYNTLNSPDGTLVTVPAWENDPTLATAAAGDPAVASALAANADAYWLLLMRSAVFCGGLPNQDFLLGRGCICVPGAVCSEGSGSFETLQFVALAVILAVFVFIDAWNMWITRQDISSALALISSVVTVLNVTRASVPSADLSVPATKKPYFDEARFGQSSPAVDIDSWLTRTKTE